jgi:heterodisulfide reductase subunit B
MDDPENPKIMEDFIRAIGGIPVIYSMRNECCGAYTCIDDKELANSQSGEILKDAKEHGVDCMITACPLCLYNLNNNCDHYEVPIYYFTELLAEAMGVKKQGDGCIE